MLLSLLKKRNILIINKRNITKRDNAVYPEYHWFKSFMVYAFMGQRFFNQVYNMFNTMLNREIERGSINLDRTAKAIEIAPYFLFLNRVELRSGAVGSCS